MLQMAGDTTSRVGFLRRLRLCVADFNALGIFCASNAHYDLRCFQQSFGHVVEMKTQRDTDNRYRLGGMRHAKAVTGHGNPVRCGILSRLQCKLVFCPTAVPTSNLRHPDTNWGRCICNVPVRYHKAQTSPVPTHNRTLNP